MPEPTNSLILIRNPFDRAAADRLEIPGAQPVGAIVAQFMPAGVAEICVAVNGQVIPAAEWGSTYLAPGDQMVAAPRLHGDDDGFLGLVLNLALMVVAPGIGNAIASALELGAIATIGSFTLTWGQVIGFGVGLIGSMVIGSLTASPKPTLPGASPQSYDASPSYSWEPITTQQPGGPIARAYGRTKLFGNIIAGYVDSDSGSGAVQTARLLIDLGVGPYSGLYDFRINGQPVGYYKGVSVVSRMGHLNQEIVPSFNDTRTTYTIGAKVVDGAPITRDTTGDDYDALEVVLAAPGGLWYANDAGGLDAISVDVRVEYSDDGGGSWQPATLGATSTTTTVAGYWAEGDWIQPEATSEWNIAGPTFRATSGVLGTDPAHQPTPAAQWINASTEITTTFQSAIRLHGATTKAIRKTVRIAGLTRGIRYKVRVTNLTPDRTTSRYGDDLYFQEIREVQHDDFIYPRTVLAGIDAVATDQISGGFQFSCMAQAAIVRVWNGAAWTSAWSENPAWIIWDILTQPVLDDSLAVVRYDGFDPSRLVLADFYAFAQWCDELVPDGAGGLEARAIWGGQWDTQTDMWSAALEVAATCRATLVQRGTRFTVVWDRARTQPAQVFSVANSANYRTVWMPLADRAAAIDVEFQNGAADYSRERITVVNPAIAEDTSRRASYALRGVTRASQAWREAWYALNRNQLLKRTGELRVSIDALACTVGDLIWVQDAATTWMEGGRATGGTTTTIDLDHAVTLAPATSYELRHRAADDTISTRPITSAPGTYTTIAFSGAITPAPAADDVWVIGEVGKSIDEMIVTNISRAGDQDATLTLIQYSAAVYSCDAAAAQVESAAGDLDRFGTISGFTAAASPRVVGDGKVVVDVRLEWDYDAREKTAAVQVFVIGPDGRQTAAGRTPSDSTVVTGLADGKSYTFLAAPENWTGVLAPRAKWARTVLSLGGKAGAPQDVQAFTAQPQGALVLFRWLRGPEADIAGYEIRYNPQGAADPLDWDSAAIITRTTRGTQVTTGVVPPGAWTFLIKAVDNSGNLSPDPASASCSIVASGLSVGGRYEPDWWETGTLTGLVMHGPTRDLIPTSTAIASAAGWSTFDEAVPAPVAACQYDTPEFDLGIAGALRAYCPISSYLLPGAAGIASPDAWLRAENAAAVEVLPWTLWDVGEQTMRFMQWRLSMSPADGVAGISAAQPAAEAAYRYDQDYNVAAPGGVATVVFGAPFFRAPSVQATPVDSGGAALTAVITAQTTTGFTAKFYNSAGALTATTFNWIARGV